VKIEKDSANLPRTINDKEYTYKYVYYNNLLKVRFGALRYLNSEIEQLLYKTSISKFRTYYLSNHLISIRVIA